MLSKNDEILNSSASLLTEEEKFSFGHLLGKIRRSKNISIEEVSNVLKIRKFFIEAIEEGEFQKLPGGIYTTGFIQAYARFLNLDSDFIKKNFQIDHYINIPPLAINFPTHKQKNHQYFSSNILLLSILLSLCLTAGFLFFQYKYRYFELKKASPSSHILSIDTPSQDTFNTLHPSLITFYALKPTWIQITEEDNKNIDLYILSEGETLQIPYKKDLYLTAENSDNIQVYKGIELINFPCSTRYSFPYNLYDPLNSLSSFPLTADTLIFNLESNN